jgi:hypothetical protein
MLPSWSFPRDVFFLVAKQLSMVSAGIIKNKKEHLLGTPTRPPGANSESKSIPEVPNCTGTAFFHYIGSSYSLWEPMKIQNKFGSEQAHAFQMAFTSQFASDGHFVASCWCISLVD